MADPPKKKKSFSTSYPPMAVRASWPPPTKESRGQSMRLEMSGRMEMQQKLVLTSDLGVSRAELKARLGRDTPKEVKHEEEP